MHGMNIKIVWANI